jgi:hypothetical protein
MLDSNFSEIPAYQVEAQDRWLDAQLSQAQGDSSVKMVLLCCHHPPYTNSRAHGPDRGVQDHFVQRARRFSKVAAFFVGHVHSYERLRVDGLPIVISGGGGAPLTTVRTGRDAKFTDEYPGGEKRPFNLCLLTIHEDRVEVEVHMLQESGDWKIGDQFTLAPGR